MISSRESLILIVHVSMHDKCTIELGASQEVTKSSSLMVTPMQDLTLIQMTPSHKPDMYLLAKGPVRCNGRKEILIIKKIFAKENSPHILLRGAIVLLKYAHVL